MTTNPTALLAGLLVVMALGAPAWARTVTIETAVPLSDHSPETLERAIKEALDITVRDAATMGFSWIRLDGARVLEDSVAVRMVATDDDSEDDARIDELGGSVPLEDASDGF